MMFRRDFLLFLGAAPLLAVAVESEMSLDDALDAAQAWARENLDEDFLRQLGEPDRDQIRNLLERLEQAFQGDHVLNLAPLRETAQAALPLLERFQETLPYALWLRPRIEYLEVADEFRLVLPPPQRRSEKPPAPPPEPTPAQEREAWGRKLGKRPRPDAAQKYVSRLKQVFVKQRVPPELVWLAEVESAFDPRARSPAGAAGLFQLMPATARQQGLRLWPMDQRLQPEPSAAAAAGYLHSLHRRFGDWRLALAAYNCGEGTVERRLRTTQTKSFDAIAPRLPAETQMYVPRVEAVILRREGIKLEQLRVPAKAGPLKPSKSA